MSDCKEQKVSKGSNKSGVTTKEYVSQLGGFPPKKSVEEIEKANSPSGRGKPPGAFRP
jgi:hypothetical protein